MNYKFLLPLLLLSTAAASAQDYTKMSRALCRITQQKTMAMRGKSFTGNNSKITIFIKGDEEAIAPFCVRHQGDIHIANVPLNQLSALSADPRITYMEASTVNHYANMNHALATIQADKAQQGLKLPQAFNGRGVLCGNIDITHDYSHPTFRSTLDGRQRIVRAWDWFNNHPDMTELREDNFPIGALYTDTTTINNVMCSKDCSVAYHGTHTASITAGSGWGTPFRGVAPEADIYMTTVLMGNNKALMSEELQKGITTATEALAFQNIFDYADSIGKPCVINYSAGSTQDITDADALLNEYFSRMTGPGKIIVASAGNEGIIEHNLLTIGNGNAIAGGRMDCLNDNEQLQLSMRTNGGKVTLRLINLSDPSQQEVSINLDCTLKDGILTSPSGLLLYDFNVIQSNDIEIQVYPGHDGFDLTHIGYDIFINNANKQFNSNDYAILIESADGCEATLYAPKINFMPTNAGNGITLTGGTAGGSVLSPGCLPSIICVGATTWRTTYTTINGEVPIGQELGTPGTRATFSSVGPTLHGLTKPDVVAPGAFIVAAYNHFDQTLTSDPYNMCAAETTFRGTTYRYYNDSGTSMSAPIVSGVIALWLQADPTLTPERAMQVIAKTSRQPDTTLDYPNNLYGYGEINAYAGLLEVLGLSGIHGISSQHLNGANVRPTPDGNISITLDKECDSPLHCRLYSAQGCMIKSTSIPAGTTTATLPADGRKGIIIVQIDGYGSTIIRTR